MTEQMGGVETAVVPNESKGLSLRGLVEVFHKPADFFKELKNNPKILLSYVVFGILVVGFIFLVRDYIVEMQMSSPQLQEQMETQGTTPAQMEKILRVTVVLFGSLAWSLYPLLAAGLAFFLGNFVFGGKADFKQVFSVILYGAVLYMVGSYVVLPLIIAKGSLLVSLSPAAFISEPELTDPLYLFLSKFNVFNIWEIIVVGIGLATVYDISRNKGYMIAVLSVGLLSLLHVAMTLFSS